MRLIQILGPDKFRLVEFFGDQIPSYAILSHRWGPEEVNYQEFVAGKGHA